MVEAIIDAVMEHGSELSSILALPLIYALYKIMVKAREDSQKIRQSMLDDMNILKGNDLSVIRAELQTRTERYIQRGYTTNEGMQATEALYERYTLLGGNSFIKTNMEHVRTLPMKVGGGKNE